MSKEQEKSGEKNEYFVAQESIVREIWGRADMVLFIFAGAAAEFAVNKAVDWLYYTGKLPADPLGRLFSTVNYARRIVFSPLQQANQAIDTIADIHSAVENNRGAAIPDWAYRDVLYMLVHYSVAAYELFARRLTEVEREEVYDVFARVGRRMGLKELPATYSDWLPARAAHMAADLQYSRYTADLYRQYKKHLGPLRYRILLEGQKLVVPHPVLRLLRLGGPSLLGAVLPVYKLARALRLDGLLQAWLLPGNYRQDIRELNMV